MKRVFFILLAILILGLSVGWYTMRPVVDPQNPILVTDGFARSSNASGAAFMTITNQSGGDDRLVGAKSDVAAMVELHTHRENAEGVMMMRPIEGGILIGSGDSAELARGGDHVMMMGLSGALEGEVTITLVFEKSGEVTVTLPVDNSR